MSKTLACSEILCRRDHWHSKGPALVNAFTSTFQAGELCGITGEDGCGKGLLLNLLGLLEPPDSGHVVVRGHVSTELNGADAQKLRNEAYGFLFNHPCLLPAFSVAENVAMPLFRVCGGDAREARCRTLEALEFCGVTHLESVLATKLDPRQRRSVAMARALVHGPDILIVISPGGDSTLPALARRVAEELGLIVLWAGEEHTILPFAHRLLRMREGDIISDERS